MAEHEPCIGQSDDWYTPPEIFTALALTFDLDPCPPPAKCVGAASALPGAAAGGIKWPVQVGGASLMIEGSKE